MIRVVLPHHLRKLAQVGDEVIFEVPEPATLGSLLSSIESSYPVLRGSIRDAQTAKRRPFVRFFACGQDLSHELADTLLPATVIAGTEPFFIIGAMAGG